MKVGLLHPGNMGAALAACVDGQVLWASEGRSEATRTRAAKVGALDRGDLGSLVADADIIISVCPPGAAVGVANQVEELGFDGVYVDANAVSPATARRMAQLFSRFVDGGIIGPPPSASPTNSDGTTASARSGREGSRTRLYLSGFEASAVRALFAGSPVDARVIGSEPGQASALKMAYAGWTKGSTALLLAAAALASAEGVAEELAREWDLSIPELGPRLEQLSPGIGRKAWRFVAEMEEIAETYGDAGLPAGFHRASAEVYTRLAAFKDDPTDAGPTEIIDALLDPSGSARD